MNKKQEKQLAWHFLCDDGTLQYKHNGESIQPQVGQTLTADGDLKMCSNGMHASIDVFDALLYAPGAIVCRVEVDGNDCIYGRDKLVSRSRKILWKADATRTLHLFAVWCAQRALDREKKAGRTPRPASYKALEVKLLWLDGKASDDELRKARKDAYAADTADTAAARAAYAAADAAAAEVSYYAPYYATAAAAAAAYHASYAADYYADAADARAAERRAQSRKLTAMLNKLNSIKKGPQND